MQQPITLYLELEKGEAADLEVVSRASLAFAGAIRELAFVLDPSIELRIGFESGTEGSLSLNSIIKAVHGKPNKLTLIAVFVGVSMWFGKELTSYGVGKVLDSIFTNQEALSDRDVERIAAAVKRAMANKEAERQVRQVYRELETDKAIKGVAVTEKPIRPPADSIVPRSEFLARSSAEVLPDTEPKKRTARTKERVTLIAPVLLDRSRSWRFFLPSIGEFGAKVEDEKFLKGLVSGCRKIPMRGGIQLDVVLESREVREGGVWVIKERAITEVLRVRPTPVNLDLFLRLSDESDSDGD